MIDAVIFDFDGVLADTEALHLGAFQEAFLSRGWSLDERAYFERYLGYDDRGLIAAYVRDHHLRLAAEDEDRLLALKSAAFRARLSAGAVLYPGAAECVARLGARYPLGIATGSLRAEVVDILSAARLLTAFQTIVAADDGIEAKPSPAPYLAAAQRLGVNPDRCMVIEDSVGGLAAARAAGMRTVAIATTLPREALGAADRVVDRLDEITVELLGST